MSSMMRLYKNHVPSFALAGELCPGVCRLETVPSFDFDWQTRKGSNQTGGRKYYRGRALSKFSFEVSLYTDDHLDAFEEWLDKVAYAPDAPKGVDAFEIGHPLVNAWGVQSCVILSVKAPKLDESKNLYVAYVELEESREPQTVVKPVVATKSTPNADQSPEGVVENPAVAAAQAELARARGAQAASAKKLAAKREADAAAGTIF